MSKKQEFIKFVEMAIEAYPQEMNDEARIYWEAFKGKEEVEKPMFTDNGKLILKYLQENKDTEAWKARDIAEGLFIGSRAVSGAMRKLCTDGYVEKIAQDPVVYALTENGKNIVIED
jgi:DNA-binding MarR family transcriptional regulator